MKKTGYQTKRPALGGRFQAAAGAALAVASACAMTLLWPWDEPPPAGIAGSPAATAGAARSVAVATAPGAASMVSPQGAPRQEAAPGAAIASPFGSAGMARGATQDHQQEEAYAATASGAEAQAAEERGECGDGCQQAAATQAGPSLAAPVALLLAATLPKDLDAWSLDPQPLAPPSATPQPAPRPLGNTPQIPDEADATPGEDSPPESEGSSS